MDSWTKHRINLVTGHFGSGKTEFSAHLAMHLAERYDDVAAVDLDIINVYFRLREQEEVLRQKGIEVYSTAEKVSALDIPALDPAIYAPFQNGHTHLVVDVGGNPSGARALGRYKPYLKEGDYDAFLVVNANRPESMTAEQVIEFKMGIEFQSKVKITQLVNVTHALKHTAMEDLRRGQALVEEVSEKTGLPIWGTACLAKLAPQLRESGYQYHIMPMELMFRADWMS